MTRISKLGMCRHSHPFPSPRPSSLPPPSSRRLTDEHHVGRLDFQAGLPSWDALTEKRPRPSNHWQSQEFRRHLESNPQSDTVLRRIVGDVLTRVSDQCPVAAVQQPNCREGMSFGALGYSSHPRSSAAIPLDACGEEPASATSNRLMAEDQPCAFSPPHGRQNPGAEPESTPIFATEFSQYFAAQTGYWERSLYPYSP